MIPVSEALETIRLNTPILTSETVELTESVGRVLAVDIAADSDMPPFDRSQMDGFAVKAHDTQMSPVSLQIVGEAAAGRGWHSELMSGQAVRIMTGAPVPAGADAVQKLELAVENGSNVVINSPTDPGKFIVRQGAEIKKGDTVFRAGEVITEHMIAALAAFGYGKVEVGIRPRVCILSTGSELVDVAEVPGRDQIRNSNSPMLEVIARKYGADVSVLPPTGDDLEKLKSSISSARGVNIVVMTGGVSVGKYDLTKAALQELGAEIFFERIQLKPGKPAVFARLGEMLAFGLPGNPVSAAVTFYLFVRAALLQMQRATETKLRTGTAVLSGPVRGAKERDGYLPAALKTGRDGRLVAEPLRWGGSSDFVGFARAEAFIVIPQGKNFDQGDLVEIAWL